VVLDADETRAALAGRTKSHWAEIGAAIHDKIGAKIDARKQDHLATILDRFEAELAPVLSTFYDQHKGNPNLAPEVRELLGKITSPEHFTESLLIGVAVGATIYPILGAMTAPTAQDIGNEVWSNNPTAPLSPAELAAAALKNVDVPGGREAEAAKSGINKDRFAALVQIAGNAIGFQEALLLQRRGQLTGTTLDDVLGYSNINPRFYAAAKNLIYSSPGVGAVITGRLKTHLADAKARALYTEAGGNPDNFDWELASAGRPIGVAEAAKLWKRGWVTDARLAQVVAQSDVNPDYLDLVQMEARYHPPVRSIPVMLRSGGIDDARATQLLRENGVDEADIPGYIAEGHKTAAQTHKDISASQVITAYGEQLLSRADAAARIVALGYPAASVELLLAEADAKAKDARLRAAVTLNHSLFTRYHATAAETQTALAGLNIPAADITQLLAVWTHERSANAPDLTVAQWQGLLRRGSISPARFDAEMNAYGYTTEQADFLAELAFPPPKAPAAAKSKDLSVSQLGKLYALGTITAAEYRTRLTELGYSAAEANEIIALTTTTGATTGKSLTVAQLTKLYEAGTITLDEFGSDLLALGYSQTDAAELISLATPPTPAP
jgi:hypothetical protein